MVGERNLAPRTRENFSRSVRGSNSRTPNSGLLGQIVRTSGGSTFRILPRVWVYTHLMGKAEARRLECPPSPNESKSAKQYRSSYIHVPTFWSLLYTPLMGILTANQDRDEYVTINWANIAEEWRAQYKAADGKKQQGAFQHSRP